jgi:hypothetical protein
MHNRVTQLADGGVARLIMCRDPIVARTLFSNRKLRALCRLAGETDLLYQETDEAAVRRILRELGYVLPRPS